jgi:ABC-type polysaccharide/polyol phosphate transport system ATPase subunit
MQSNQIVIRVEHVTQKFRVIHERPDTLRELFAKFFHRRVSQFHDFEAVKDVSFEVRKGEMVGIVGSNGSGKSTLLKIISGVYRPTVGQVEVTGIIAPLLELGAGFHPELTGRENILLNGLIMGYSKREMQAREQKIIDFAGIGEFIDVPVKQYSSGMYMRLAFSVATEIDPDVLVLDEVLAVGDIAFQKKCFDRLERFREGGKTILLVTHSLAQVIKFCNRAILIDSGNVIVDGHPDEVVERFTSRSGLARQEIIDAAPQPGVFKLG